MPRRFRRRRYKKRGLLARFSRMRVGTIARKAYSGFRYLKSMINSEKYHYDSQISGTPTTTAGITHLTNISQGDNDGSRSGNSILVKKITYNVSYNINASASNTWIREVILIDRQQISDTPPTYSDVFDVSGTTVIAALLNKATLGRFTILRDRIFTLNNNGKQLLNRKGSIYVNKHVRYNGTTGADIQKNGIYVMYVSNETTNAPQVTSVFRVFYHDN